MDWPGLWAEYDVGGNGLLGSVPRICGVAATWFTVLHFVGWLLGERIGWLVAT